MLAFRPRADGPVPSDPVRVDVSAWTQRSVGQAPSGRMSDVLAALSVILDAAERRAPGSAVRTAYLAGRLAAEMRAARAAARRPRHRRPPRGCRHDRPAHGRRGDRRGAARGPDRRCAPAAPHAPGPTSAAHVRPWRRSGFPRASPSWWPTPTSAGMGAVRPARAATTSPRTGDCWRSPRPSPGSATRRHRPRWNACSAPPGAGAWTPASRTSRCGSARPGCGRSSRTRTCHRRSWRWSRRTTSAGPTRTGWTPSPWRSRTSWTPARPVWGVMGGGSPASRSARRASWVSTRPSWSTCDGPPCSTTSASCWSPSRTSRSPPS